MKTYELPYKSVSCTLLLPRSQLPRTPGLPIQNLNSATLPQFRLNLLESDGDYLYFAVCNSYVAEYKINRARGLQVVPVESIPIDPPTAINNIRIAKFDEAKGGKMLLMTGCPGHEMERGSLSFLQLRDERDSRVAKTVFLPLKSTWGLAVHNDSGKIAIGSNSFCAIVFSILPPGQDGQGARRAHAEDESDEEDLLELHTPPLVGTHYHNIPCLAFSNCGSLLASASIDRTFALFDITGGPLVAGRRLYQSPQFEGDHSTNSEWCWCVHWLGSQIETSASEGDDVWRCIRDQRARKSWNDVGQAAYPTSQRSSLFADSGSDCVSASFRSDSYSSEIAMYDDSLRGDSAQSSSDNPSVLHADRDDLSGHRIYREGDEQYMPYPRSVRHKAVLLQQEESIYSGGSGFALHSTLPHNLRNHTSDKETALREDPLLLVGRQDSISLMRVTRQSTGPRENLFNGADVEELTSIKVRESASSVRSGSRCAHVIEIKELSLIVLTHQIGLGVFLLRVVRPAEQSSQERGQNMGNAGPRLVVEKVIKSGKHDVMGTCVVKRPGATSATQYFELWIAYQNGSIECWELSRGILPVDPSCVGV